MHYLLDFLKPIHRLLVKYNLNKSRISKAVAFIFSQLVLHRDSYPCNITLVICCIKVVPLVHTDIALKNKSVLVLLLLQAKQPSIYCLVKSVQLHKM